MKLINVVKVVLFGCFLRVLLIVIIFVLIWAIVFVFDKWGVI